MQRQFPADIDPLDWNTVQPRVDELLDADLTADNTRAWLQDWSDLFSIVDEAVAKVYREVTENTADEQADARFKHIVTEIMPASARAEQALKLKWLSVEDYQPTAETAELYRRFKAEIDIFHEENLPIISELRLLDKQYDEIIGGLSIEWQDKEKTMARLRQLGYM